MGVDTILSYFQNEAPFVILFVFLLFYVLRENGRREQKYEEIIDNLSKAVNEKLTVLQKKIDDFWD